MKTKKQETRHYWFRKWLAILLSVMLCAGTMSVNVLAAEEQTETENITVDTVSDSEQETVDEEAKEDDSESEDAQKEQQEEASLYQQADITNENIKQESQEQKTGKEEETASESNSSEEAKPAEMQNGNDAESADDGIPVDQTVEEVPAQVETVQEPAQNYIDDDPLMMNESSVLLESGSKETIRNISEKEFIQTVSSSNPDVVSVSSFDNNSVTITAGIAGDAVISVIGTDGNVCEILVTVEFWGMPLDFYDTNVTLTAGETTTIERYDCDETIKSVSVSDSKIVSVDDPQSLDITALRPGKAIITVKGSAGTICNINVTVKSFLNVSSININKGEHRYIEFNTYSDTAIIDNFTIATSNYKIATSGIANNLATGFKCKLIICGKSAGKAVITVKGENDSVCKINVNVINAPFNLSASKLTIDRAKNYRITATGSIISSAVSSNAKICAVKKINSRTVQLVPLKTGSVKVTCKNAAGVTKTVAVTITKRYFLSSVVNLSKPFNQSYGSGYINGTGAPYSKASVTIGKKTYSTTVNAKGNFVIRNVPYVKIGTVLSVKFTLQGQSATKKIKILKGTHSVYAPNYTFKDNKSVTVQLKNVHSGDKIKITVNGKNYYREFKNTYKSITVDVAIKKPQKYGIKMTIYLLNRFNQELAKTTDYIYHSDTVTLGDSKAKVKWLVGWNEPIKKEYYSWGEVWYYDWNDDDGITDAALYFDSKGKVTDWWVEE